MEKNSEPSHPPNQKELERMEAEAAWNQFYTPLNGFPHRFFYAILIGICILSSVIFLVTFRYFAGTLKLWENFLLATVLASLFYWPSCFFLVIRPSKKKSKHEEDVKSIFIREYARYSKLLNFIV